MRFDFRAIFSGLCAYVPDRTLDVPEAPPTKMMVVMVDARVPRRSRDGKEMRPHFPRIFIRGSQIRAATGLPSESDVTWRIDRKRIEIAIPEESLHSNRFEVFQGPRYTTAPFLPKRFEDFSWGADMQKVAPDFAAVDPSVFDDRLSKGLVSAQVILDKGLLSSYKVGREVNWEFDGVGLPPQQLSNRTALDISGVEEVIIAATDLDFGFRQEVHLASRAGEPVEVFVGNVCDGCMPNELHYEDDLLPDEDFRWYYELCSYRSKWPSGTDLPIPRPRGGGRGNGAAKCMRVTLAPVAF